MMNKLILSAGFCSCLAMFISPAYAAGDWGPCTTASGQPFSYNATIDSSIAEPSKNYTGSTFPDFFQWKLGSTYSGVCECPDSPSPQPTYYKTMSNLATGHTSGYFVLNNNIEIAAKVYVVNNGLVAIPFEDVSNKSPHTECGTPTQGWATGSEGVLTLYINYPFIGKQDIPRTTLFSVYGTKKPGVYGTTPMSEVTLSGSIDIAQGCELEQGSALEINLGDYQARDFKNRKGLIPSGGQKITKEIKFTCLNVPDGVKVYLRLEGMANANDNRAIDLGNPDIGAIIENANTKSVLIPNNNDVEEMIVSDLYDSIYRTASAEITAYPISTTGKLPKAGSYEGIASIRIDVE